MTFCICWKKTDSAHNGCLLVASTGSQAPARQGNSIGDTPFGLQPPEPNAKSTTRQYITDTGFQKLIDDQSGGHTITGSGGTQECKLLVAHNSNVFSHASSQPAAFSILGGYLEIKNTDTPPTPADAAQLINLANENTKPWASAHDATAKILKHSDSRITNQTGKPYERNALSNAVQPTIKKLGNTPEPNSASKTLKAIFGADEKEKKDDTEAELNSEIIPQGVAALAEDTPLGSIDNLQTLNDILTYYDWQVAEGIAKLKQDASINSKKHGTKQDCTTLEKPDCKPDMGCKYNETTKACEEDPKPAVSKTNQETGKTEISVKFSDYGSKDKCEEVNKGKDKPVCGWRKGKDGETEPKKEMCRNGSFLANKKFALIGAFFMRLLVF
uniref:Variant surface glycoprotein 1125.5096 n=1 Tax=Trypanosoma brucei TaxID=5691 RepID=A0A1J0RBU9_9TRYP|nr:variant surface glycoprotein 1125.5096 [Trypanosoma brucei]